MTRLDIYHLRSCLNGSSRQSHMLAGTEINSLLSTFCVDEEEEERDVIY